MGDILESAVSAEFLSSGLQSRLLLTPFGRHIPSWQFVFLQYGTLHLRQSSEDPPQHIEAPALVLCPPGGGTLTLAAGSSGTQLAMSELGLAGVIGNRPVSAELRLMTRDFVQCGLPANSSAYRAIEQIFALIVEETRQDGIGSQTIVEAQTRCALIRLWRHASPAAVTSTQDATQTLLLRRFRRMVEAQFRNRWRVQDYAESLGTTTDRLHDITTSALGRTPLSLIHERCLYEAKALLQRSTMTVEQVASSLGFQSAAQFSNFFKRLSDERPGRYRKAARAKALDHTAEPEHLTDWP